jgi:hypothetical protein
VIAFPNNTTYRQCYVLLHLKFLERQQWRLLILACDAVKPGKMFTDVSGERNAPSYNRLKSKPKSNHQKHTAEKAFAVYILKIEAVYSSEMSVVQPLATSSLQNLWLFLYCILFYVGHAVE